MLNIITIDYPLEAEGIINTSFEGDETLLDADLVIADPSSFDSFCSGSIYVNSEGNRTLRSPESNRVMRILNKKRYEIETLLSNGKVIIVFISPMYGFLGEVNPRYDYEAVTNYYFLPVDCHYILDELKSGKGSSKNSIILGNPHSIFTPYFEAFKEELEYSAYLDMDDEDKDMNFLLNRSKKPVGFIYKYNKGIIAFLPPPNYLKDNNKLIGVLLNCTKKFITKHEVTPPPNWVKEYQIVGEDIFEKEIELLNKELGSILDKISKIEEDENNLTKYKTLLYETGPELEGIVIDAFKLFGFIAENRKVNDLEHDIVFHSEEGKGIAELEGKDNDAIHQSKFDQLNRVVDEDFEHTGSYSQGILIGNHFRLIKPDKRKDPFTDKVLIVAKKKRFGLLTTPEIFNAVQRIFENPNDEAFKKQCRERILITEGSIIKLI